jgi:hypothetical protein
MKLSDFLTDLGRPVAYYPELARALDDVKEAIFVCQMAYWKGKEQDPEGWIYKSSEEIETETALSYKEQSNVRAGLKAKKLLVDWYSRTEHKLYFKIDWDAVNALWEGHLTKGHMPKSQMPPDQREDGTLPKVISPNDQKADGILPKVISLNGISENTTEITSENTREGDGISLPVIWERVLEQLKPTTLPAFFQQYVQDSQAVRYDGNTLFVLARSQESCEWLEGRVQQSAERLLVGIMNQDVSVSFLVADVAEVSA